MSLSCKPNKTIDQIIVFTTHAIYTSLLVKAEVTPQGIKVHFTELTLLVPRRDYMITSVRSTDVTSPCTELGKKKKPNWQMQKTSNIVGNMIYFSRVVFDFIYHTILNWKFADKEKL